MKHTVQLVGGPHDGTLYCVEYWLPSLFLLRPITLAEYERLKIDEFTCWKAPEDLYERVGRTTIFKYVRTIHYNPDDLPPADGEPESSS